MEQLRSSSDRVDMQRWIQELDRRTSRLARRAYEDAKSRALEESAVAEGQPRSYAASAESDTWNAILGTASSDFSEAIIGKLLHVLRLRMGIARKWMDFRNWQKYAVEVPRAKLEAALGRTIRDFVWRQGTKWKSFSRSEERRVHACSQARRRCHSRRSRSDVPHQGRR